VKTRIGGSKNLSWPFAGQAYDTPDGGWRKHFALAAFCRELPSDLYFSDAWLFLHSKMEADELKPNAISLWRICIVAARTRQRRSL
jgi:hypothetical protein